jgi:hypothetical protein
MLHFQMLNIVTSCINYNSNLSHIVNKSTNYVTFPNAKHCHRLYKLQF